jgi:hypothetical protein
MPFARRILAIPSRQLVGGHHMATDWYVGWTCDCGDAAGECLPPPVWDSTLPQPPLVREGQTDGHH